MEFFFGFLSLAIKLVCGLRRANRSTVALARRLAPREENYKLNVLLPNRYGGAARKFFGELKNFPIDKGMSRSQV